MQAHDFGIYGSGLLHIELLITVIYFHRIETKTRYWQLYNAH